jgi:hypothetical protein
MFIKICLLRLHVGCLRFQLGGYAFLAYVQGLRGAGAGCGLGIAGRTRVVFGIGVGNVLDRGLASRRVFRENRCTTAFPKDLKASVL